MQNPNEDTEWNDVLRAKGILPAKPKEAEVTEEDLIRMVEQTIKQKSGSELDILYYCPDSWTKGFHHVYIQRRTWMRWIWTSSTSWRTRRRRGYCYR